ncbi:MAG TPA: hypothetical protein VNB59_04080 [Solirubrobacterales bacterium]|jgi:hypothetical protein|nr:hypothetical protein [Solirubrobacterales bacterium]
MGTIAYGASLSRVKALIGALLATLAIAGAVGASAPEPASAMISLEGCRAHVHMGHFYEEWGFQELADEEYDAYWACVRAAQ